MTLTRVLRQHAIGLLFLAACGCSPTPATAVDASAYLYVWAWDVDKDADDFLAVVDVDRASPPYGRVVRTAPSPGGRGADAWPHGSTGRAYAHGAVFGQD